MTSAFLHSLNIGTLSTWLSVAGFGTVGVVVTTLPPEPTPAAPFEETTIADFDFAIGPEDSGGFESIEPSSLALAAPADPGMTAPETPPAPPELPPLAEFGALPDLPELPAAPRSVAASSQAAVPRAASQVARPSVRPSASASSSGGGAPGGNGMSETRRLAAGHMPAPAYPAAARRGGQTGTVVVEFTVDQNGRVIAAHAVQPSPWPLLNNEAVRTVRRWKFPPGPVMKLQRPIVFQLR